MTLTLLVCLETHSRLKHSAVSTHEKVRVHVSLALDLNNPAVIKYVVVSAQSPCKKQLNQLTDCAYIKQTII